ncbi:MAG TPA: hypothetical protein PLV72_01620, partial [Candidatus Magasanikbacteria bacterium]|nr:hypothetical protein [Candidatus Magasanikbacteria bacterium]
MTHFFGFITGTWRKLGEWLLRLSHFKYRRTAIGVFVTMLFAGTFLCAGTTQAFDISGMLGDFAIDIVSAVSGLLLSLTQICIGLSIFALKMFI